MIVNASNISELFRSFKLVFDATLSTYPDKAALVASDIPITGESVNLPLAALTGSMREWLGDRQIQNLAAYMQRLTPKNYEQTIGVPKNSIEDDQIGLYRPAIQQMAMSARTHAWDLIRAAFTATTGAAFATLVDGLDNVAFLSASHTWPGGGYTTAQANLGTEVLDSDAIYTAVMAMASYRGADGKYLSAKPDTFFGGSSAIPLAEAWFNSPITAAGAANPHYHRIAADRILYVPEMTAAHWVMFDTSKPLKPCVIVRRKDPEFVAMDAPTDEAAFMKKEFRYGVDDRKTFAFICWWLAYASTGTT